MDKQPEFKLNNNKEIVGSVFSDEQKLLKSILKIHCNDGYIDLDPMYSKGNFYKEILEPRLKYDINPQNLDVIKCDARNLPISSGSIQNMILDPPFCFGIHGKTEQNISAKRFTILKNFSELESLYKGILKEAFRVLNTKGILIFKCQDYTDNKTIMTHCLYIIGL